MLDASQLYHGRHRAKRVLKGLLFCALVSWSHTAFASETGVRSDKWAKRVQEAFDTGMAVSEGGKGKTEIDVRHEGRNSLLVTRDAAGSVSASLTCLLCTSDEVLSEARSLGALVSARTQKQTVAEIDSSQADVDGRVYVDGIPLTPLGRRHPIEPGRHDIKVVKKGAVLGRSITIAPESRHPLPTSYDTLKGSRARRLRAAVITGGMGLTTAALGGLFLWLDRDCATDDCRLKHYLAGPGYGLLAAGVLVQGVVIWLLWPRRRGGEVRP
jgi:hypothetical protein